jgi:hypothetical protein
VTRAKEITLPRRVTASSTNGIGTAGPPCAVNEPVDLSVCPFTNE